MEKHRCKLCSRTFANGRALGGHMKGHLAALPLPPKPTNQQVFESASSWSSSSSEEQEEEKSLAYALRENPKKSCKLADPVFAFAADSGHISPAAAAAVQDRESETESRNPTRKRSKRTRKSAFVQQSVEVKQQQPKLKKKQSLAESPPVSSISDTSPEEDVAMCLIMLSRDKWIKQETSNVVEQEVEESEHVKKVQVKFFQCEECKKKFRSSQALAGHKATHRKNKYEDDEKEKMFECPFCFKVFGSGQALGGHKRSHMLAHGNVSAPPAAAAAVDAACTSSSTAVNKVETKLIDLNLPAPVEDDDNSVVSDAEVVNT